MKRTTTLKTKNTHATPSRNSIRSIASPTNNNNNNNNNNGGNTRGNLSALEQSLPKAVDSTLLDGEILKTHIEVCARIRPTQIHTNKQGYFASSSSSSSSSSLQNRRPLGGLSPKNAATNTHGVTNSNTNFNSNQSDSLLAWEVSKDGETAAQNADTDPVQGRTNSYTLDHVYGPESTTNQIYQRSVQSLVHRAMEGYHSTILAYGQTSTGKTFTMTGTKESPGLIPLSLSDCFRYVRNLQESREYLIRISYLEVYKEHIRDLLNPTPEPIRIYDGPNGLVIRGLKEEVVTSPDQVFAILTKGEKRRQVGATKMNHQSSRSHVMVRLWIESTAVGSSTTRLSSLSLVDLAGSESVRLNGSERRAEGQYINKSLMTLGQVVLSLSEGKTGHIPYRDSKLTRLLQPSLSGNAQMVLLCCISPLASHLEESHNTFKFATRAKKVEQKAMVNVAGDEQSLLQNYKTEIEDLRKQLAEAKEQQRLFQERAASSASGGGAAAASATAATGEEEASKYTVEDSDGEIKELAEAIKTMERLVLKSRPHPQKRRASMESTSNENLNILLEDDDEMDDEDDLLVDIPPRTPIRSEEDALHTELDRIRGLLGSVLEKRGMASTHNGTLAGRRLDYSSPPRNDEDEKEVETLRKQLEEQATVTSIRKADSSFLQAQLKEKDNLLAEVSKVLEALEKRQSELEKENAALRLQLSRYQNKNAATRP